MERIVVGVDGSASSHEALDWAVTEARLRGAELEAVHAWQYPTAYSGGASFAVAAAYDMRDFEVEAKAALDAIMSKVDASGLAAPIRETCASGAAAAVLIEAAQAADLLVVGSRGRGGFTGLLLGSVSQQIAHHASCPVVIVPGRRVTATNPVEGHHAAA